MVQQNGRERKEKEESMVFIERREGGWDEGKGKSVVFVCVL